MLVYRSTRHCRLPVEGERDGEPDGSGVTGGRQMVSQSGVSDTPVVRNPVAVASGRVEVEIVRHREQSGERVGDGHADQHGIGRVAHRPSQQDDADHDVVDDGQ